MALTNTRIVNDVLALFAARPGSTEEAAESWAAMWAGWFDEAGLLQPEDPQIPVPSPQVPEQQPENEVELLVPTDDLVLDWDASSGNHGLSGTEVTSLNDASGNDNHATPMGGDSGGQIVAAGAPSGIDCIAYNGSSESNAKTGPVGLPTGAADRTWYWVGKVADNAATNWIFVSGSLSTAGAFVVEMRQGTPDFARFTSTSGEVNANEHSYEEWAVWCIKLASGTLTMHKNGTLVGTGTPTFNTVYGMVAVGANLGGTNVEQLFGRLLCYSVAHDETNQSQAEQALMSQWEIGAYSPGSSLEADDLGGALGVLDYATDGLSLNLGVNPGDVSVYAADVAADGFKWVRSRLYWSDIEESEGVYDWTTAPNYDRIVDEFNALGIGVLQNLQMTHNTPIYGAGSAPPYDAGGRTAYANFAAAAAAHWAGAKVMFELGNEPNISNFWPMVNTLEGALAAADEYSALAHVVIPAMRAADPNVFITGPGLAGTGVNLSVAQAYLQRLIDNGVVALLDRVSVHFYTAESFSPTDNMAAGRAPEEAHYDSYWDLVGHDVGTILNSEHGWRTDGGATQNLLQASYHVRDFLFGLSRGVRFRSWYLRANTSGQEVFFINGRPAMTAAGVLAQELGSFRFVRRIATGNSNQYVFEFVNDGGVVRLAVWKRDSTVASAYNHPAVGTATLTDVVGGTSTIASSGGSIALSLSVHPVYVRLPGLLI